MDDLRVRGRTLLLRYATADDADALFALADAEATQWFSWGPYADRSGPLEYIDALAGRRAEGTLLDFLVVHDDHGPVGVTGLSEYNQRDRRATVGTWFGRDHWGTGINLESKALIARLAFDALGFHRLTAWANTRNGRSQAALERVGFVREGVLRAYNTHASGVHDVVAFGMTPAGFAASPLAAIEATITGEPPPIWLAP
jgi:ribosomal-protein-alanine N-acetyltransferase